MDGEPGSRTHILGRVVGSTMCFGLGILDALVSSWPFDLILFGDLGMDGCILP